MEITGHRGASQSNVVSWGAAVVVDSGEIFDFFSHERKSIDLLYDMVVSRDVQICPRIPLQQREYKRLTLLKVAKACSVHELFRPEHEAVLLHSEDAKHSYFTFNDVDDYKRFARDLIEIFRQKSLFEIYDTEISEIFMAMDFERYMAFTEDPDD